MIREAISSVVDGKSLSRDEAKSVFSEIMNGEATEAQIASLITGLRMKGETIEEIQGAAEAMRSVVAKVTYRGRGEVLDIVGTGGDSKASFNVSTASAIVAAGAGCIVAKHGNRAVSSKSGAADVLDALGVKIETLPERNSEILSRTGLAFLFAPLHHPAMKFAAKPRKEIGIRTIFNILGPMTNPASASTYLLGSYSEELSEKLANVLAGLGIKKALVVSGSGYDEATLTGKTVAFEVTGKKVARMEFEPADFGFGVCSEKDFRVADAEESAVVIMGILDGKEKGPRRSLVLLNAGMGIYANMKAKTIKEGIELAARSIDSGKALGKLEMLVEETNK